MKYSEIVFDTVGQYLAFITEEDEPEVEIYLAAAKSYVLVHSGLTLEELDANEYFVMPVLMLVSSFYENKSIAMTEKMNAVYENLLSLGTVYSL